MVSNWNKASRLVSASLKKLNLTVFKTNFAEALQTGGIEQLDSKVTLFSVTALMRLFLLVTLQGSPEHHSDDFRCRRHYPSGIGIHCGNQSHACGQLLGISPSGFNATGQSDIRNYYDHIKSKQELNRDAIQTVLKAIQLVEFGHVDPSISFKFNELGEANAGLQQSQLRQRSTCWLCCRTAMF